MMAALVALADACLLAAFTRVTLKTSRWIGRAWTGLPLAKTLVRCNCIVVNRSWISLDEVPEYCGLYALLITFFVRLLS